MTGQHARAVGKLTPLFAAAVLSVLPLSSVSAHTHRAAAKPVPLTVYAALGYDANVANAFQKATGIPTHLYDDHTGIVLAKIEAEKNRPQWDVVWLDGDQALASLDKQHLLVRGYEPKVAFTATGRSMIPANESYVPTGFSIAGSLIVNTVYQKTMPRTWSDLLKPAFKGKVGMLVPGLDGPAYPYVAGMMQMLGGVAKGEAFFQALKGNGVQIFNDPHVELAALAHGQISVAIGQSVYGIGARATNKKIVVVYPHAVTVLPNVAAISAKASPQVQAEAKEFIAFALSPAGQKARLAGDPFGDSLFWPVVKGFGTRPGVPAVTTLPLQVLNPYVWGARENAVATWFTNNIVH